MATRGAHGPRITEAFLSTQDAAELLGVGVHNVTKTLAVHDVEPTKVKWPGGKRLVNWWPRSDVERVARKRAADTKAREADERRKATARQRAKEGQ